jgi:hypothetical protein
VSSSCPTTHLFLSCSATSVCGVAVPRLQLQHGAEKLFRGLGEAANLRVRVEAIEVGRLWGQLGIDVLKSRASSLQRQLRRVFSLPRWLVLCRVLQGTRSPTLVEDLSTSLPAVRIPFPSLRSFFLYSFIHMCIHCVGHFSGLPPLPPFPPTLSLPGRTCSALFSSCVEE